MGLPPRHPRLRGRVLTARPLGAFARAFEQPGLEATLRAATRAGYDGLHLGLAVAGLPALPERVEPDDAERIATAVARHGLELFSLSGTFNPVDPDGARRAEHTARARGLIRACPAVGAPVLGLSTGTRSPEGLWIAHPDNASPKAWADLLDTLGRLLQEAESAGVVLGIEPEIVNVVADARLAARLLDELASPALGIILDPANLVGAAGLPRQDAILDEAFALLGPSIVLAHAKDVTPDGSFAAPGQGGLDWPGFLARLDPAVPLIVQDTPPAQLAEARAFLARTGA